MVLGGFLFLLTAYVGVKAQPRANDLDTKSIYVNVMNDMKARFEGGTLTDQQKLAATNVITETQSKLGMFSIHVLGLEQRDRTSQQVFAILKEYKESGNMKDEQTNKMQKLAEDTQIAMIQGVFKVFDYTPDEAAAQYNVNVADMSELLIRKTFSKYVDYSEEAPLYGATTEDALLLELEVETLTTFTASDLSLPTITPSNDIMGNFSAGDIAVEIYCYSITFYSTLNFQAPASQALPKQSNSLKNKLCCVC